MYSSVPMTAPATEFELPSRVRTVATRLRRRSTRGTQIVRDPALCEHLGEAPVDNLHFAERSDHHIRRLEIAVHDAARVGVGHGLAHLLEHAEESALILRRLAARVEQRSECLALDQLHREERLSPWFSPNCRPARCRGVELTADLGLADESFNHPAVLNSGRRTFMATSRPRSLSRA
jgi:hypothetical protein